MASNLDALCDMLDAEISDEEEEDVEEAKGNADRSDSQIDDDVMAGLDEPFEEGSEVGEPAQEALPDEEEEDEQSEMERQLKQMQEQMAAMQRKLAEKKRQKVDSSNVGGVGKASSSSGPSTRGIGSGPPLLSSTQKNQEAIPKQRKIVSAQVDMFTKSSPSSSSAAAAADSAGPRSPVKTNPFAECDRPRRVAKLHAETPMYGPALPAKTSRVLTGEEKERLMARQKSKRPTPLAKSEDAALDRLRNDLGDSSDEEEARNPMEQRYNSFGKDVQRIARANSEQQRQNPYPNQNQNPPSSATNVGFNQVRGSTLNLSTSSANARLPSNLLVEPNSKLRVANPLLDKTTLKVHMLGKRHIDMSRMKQAVLRKEHEGSDWVSFGVLYYKSCQTSKAGNSYTLCKVSDLNIAGGGGGDLASVTVFFFGAAHTRHYKIPLNKVVGILNAKVMEDRSGKGEVNLSVDHPDKILELGDSVDIGKCKETKKDGSGCTNLVNSATCDYCSYHVKRAYKSMSSKRSAIQSSFSGNEGVRSRIMDKVDPRGSYFCSSGYVNKGAPGGVGGGGGGGGSGGGGGPAGPNGGGGGGSVGRLSSDRRQKDREALAKLSGTTVDKLFKAEEKQTSNAHSVVVDGKIKFRTHLSSGEKSVVKKIAASGAVSAEFGLRLLDQTPGARTLIKSLDKQKRQAQKDAAFASSSADVNKEGSNGGCDGGAPKRVHSDDKSALQVLVEHKEKLKEERTNKILIERQMATVPKLGRGFATGDSIDLSSSSKTKKASAAATMDPSKLRALMALRGKALERQSGNYVPARKRKAENEEEKEKKREKVAKRLKSALEEGEQPKEGDEPAAVVAVSSSGERMSKERMEAIRNTKSIHQNLIDSHEEDERERMLDHLERKEAMEEKMVNTKQMEVKAMTCKACDYTDYTQSSLCKSRGHRARSIKVTKRFFECKNCKKRTSSLGDRYPKASCSNCSSSAWVRVGMAREKKGPLLDSERLVVRGAEERFLGADIRRQDLNLNL